MPFWTSVLARTLVWIVVLSRNGTINDLPRAERIIDAPHALVRNLTGGTIVASRALVPLAGIGRTAYRDWMTARLAAM